MHGLIFVTEIWSQLQLRFLKREMVSCFPSMPKKLAMTVGYFIAGAALFAVGMHLSYVNVAPQQARIKTCNDFVTERLRKKYGKP